MRAGGGNGSIRRVRGGIGSRAGGVTRGRGCGESGCSRPGRGVEWCRGESDRDRIPIAGLWRPADPVARVRPTGLYATRHRQPQRPPRGSLPRRIESLAFGKRGRRCWSGSLLSPRRLRSAPSSGWWFVGGGARSARSATAGSVGRASGSSTTNATCSPRCGRCSTAGGAGTPSTHRRWPSSGRRPSGGRRPNQWFGSRGSQLPGGIRGHAQSQKHRTS